MNAQTAMRAAALVAAFLVVLLVGTIFQFVSPAPAADVAAGSPASGTTAAGPPAPTSIAPPSDGSSTAAPTRGVIVLLQGEIDPSQQPLRVKIVWDNDPVLQQVTITDYETSLHRQGPISRLCLEGDPGQSYEVTGAVPADRLDQDGYQCFDHLSGNRVWVTVTK